MGTVLFFVMGLFLISSVYALGVSPARTTLDFKPSMKSTVSFEVINSGGQETSMVITAQGELANYIKIPQQTVSFASGESSKTLSYELDLPDKLDPGLHTAEVFILEVPKNSIDGAETSVRATLAVVTQLHLYVPYPGKYANAQMKIVNAKDGGVTFIFPVISAGEFDLSSVKAQIDVYSSDGQTKIDSFTTDSVSIASGEKKDIVRNWGASAPSGDYLAKATLIYDEGTQNFNGTFSIGSGGLVLQDIEVNSFSLGQIAKLNMLVENRMNEDVERAYIDAKILNDRGDMVSDFESAAHDVGANAKENFEVYWDTAGVKVGTYEADISIRYGEEKSTNTLKFQVEEDELIVIGLGYVISEGSKEGSNTLVVVLIVVIVLLVFMNLLWFMLLRKKLLKK